MTMTSWPKVGDPEPSPIAEHLHFRIAERDHIEPPSGPLHIAVNATMMFYEDRTRWGICMSDLPPVKARCGLTAPIHLSYLAVRVPGHFHLIELPRIFQHQADCAECLGEAQ